MLIVIKKMITNAKCQSGHTFMTVIIVKLGLATKMGTIIGIGKDMMIRKRDKVCKCLSINRTRSIWLVLLQAISLYQILYKLQTCAGKIKMKDQLQCRVIIRAHKRFQTRANTYLTSPGNGVQCSVAHQHCKWWGSPDICCYHWPQGSGQSNKWKDSSCILGLSWENNSIMHD